MNESTYSKPLPRPNRLSQPYWDAAKRHELLVEHCSACEHKWLPPADRCPKCLSKEVDWQPASGRGKVWGWIVMHQRYFAAFEEHLPYNVAYVELEEGARLMTNITECGNDEIYCNMPVEVVFEDVTAEIT